MVRTRNTVRRPRVRGGHVRSVPRAQPAWMTFNPYGTGAGGPGLLGDGSAGGRHASSDEEEMEGAFGEEEEAEEREAMKQLLAKETRKYLEGEEKEEAEAEEGEGPVFDSDEEYMRYLKAVREMEEWTMDIEDALESRVLGGAVAPVQRCFRRPSCRKVRRGRRIVRYMRGWISEMHAAGARRLRCAARRGTTLPRLERLATQFGLQLQHPAATAANSEAKSEPKEEEDGGEKRATEDATANRAIFIAIVVYALEHASSSMRVRLTCNALSSRLALPLPTVSAFFAADRSWVRDGFIERVSGILDPIEPVSEACISLFFGWPINASEFLSLTSPALADLVRTEPGFEQTQLAKLIKLHRPDTDTAQRRSGRETAKDGATASPLRRWKMNNQARKGRGQSIFRILKEEAVHTSSSDGARGRGTRGPRRQKQRTLRKARMRGNEKQRQEAVVMTPAASAAPPTAPSPDVEIETETAAELASTVSTASTPASGEAATETVEGIIGEETNTDPDSDAASLLSDKKGLGVEKEDAEKTNDEETDDAQLLQPYETDLSYLQDQFRRIAILVRISSMRRTLANSLNASDDEDEDVDRRADARRRVRHLHRQLHGTGKPGDLRKGSNRGMLADLKSHLRTLEARHQRLTHRIESRLVQCQDWLPRAERLRDALALDPFEYDVLMSLIGSAVAPSAVSLRQTASRTRGARGTSKAKVEKLLSAFCVSLEEQIRSRKYFYKSATLVREGIVMLQGNDLANDLNSCAIEIDRRMLDFVVGLDTEFSEIVDGSHLYMPTVNMEDVILPADMKELMTNTVRNFDTYAQVQKDLELDKKLSYGRGMALLFYGQSGTGKTMMANALASMLGKKMLLVNFPTFGTNSAGVIIKLIFREAVIHDAILFFDECESLFRTRENGASQVTMLLTELERHNGLSILATNRPYDLDEAMHRRITLALEFRKPDHLMRQRIWQSLCPPKLQLADDVALGDLALKYELTGGFIKNAWLSALSFAVSRNGTHPVVAHEDLLQGAAHQLRGRLSMVDFDRRIVPTRGLEDVVLPESLKESLNTIVNFGKAQTILFGQWGFQKQHGSSKGIAALFYGPPGTGKTMAAEAIGYDLGKPLKVVNCAKLLSKWVGESQKNIDQIFEEAKAVDAVLVFDEAEALFGSRGGGGGGVEASRHDTMNVGVLLHHIESFPGVVVIITNLREQLDAAFSRRFKFMLEFSMPDVDLRTRLWRLLVPEEAPQTDDVDLRVLAERHEMTGGGIKSAVFRAASRAALRPDVEQRRITQEDLIQACDEEFEKSGSLRMSTSMPAAGSMSGMGV